MVGRQKSEQVRVGGFEPIFYQVHQFLHHELGVVQAAGQLLGAAKLLQQRQLVGTELPLLVDVGDGAHERTQDNLGVVLRQGNSESQLTTSERAQEPRREPRRLRASP